MDFGFHERRVLVTGATGGIGSAVARAFSAEGARVALTYRTQRDTAEQLAAELGGGADRAMAVRYALDEPDSPESAVHAIEQRWGGVDILVANAVHRLPRRGADAHFEQVPPESWRSFVTDNLAGTLGTVSAVLPGMRERRWGRIVLVSSHVVRDGQRGQEFYAAVKSALHGFARSLAWDTGPYGIPVNVLCPGLTTTPGVLANLPATVLERELAGTPSGRLSTPEEMADAVLLLASNANLTGEAITVSGGR
ncbi:SDR family NAD(P)-dependent oxidoreductase [Nocardia sp. NPDC020380]|uniref:SDR family NAD(P)-dependent oxidoreductase n=1 Tax=Nocardia sp. NPDC020380 TaxID=3364309 RepID=UPI0037A081B3